MGHTEDRSRTGLRVKMHCLHLFAATARGRETMKRAGGLSALMDDSPLESVFIPAVLSYKQVVGVWVVQQVYVHHV